MVCVKGVPPLYPCYYSGDRASGRAIHIIDRRQSTPNAIDCTKRVPAFLACYYCRERASGRAINIIDRYPRSRIHGATETEPEFDPYRGDKEATTDTEAWILWFEIYTEWLLYLK